MGVTWPSSVVTWLWLFSALAGLYDFFSSSLLLIETSELELSSLPSILECWLSSNARCLRVSSRGCESLDSWWLASALTVSWIDDPIVISSSNCFKSLGSISMHRELAEAGNWEHFSPFKCTVKLVTGLLSGREGLCCQLTSRDFSVPDISTSQGGSGYSVNTNKEQFIILIQDLEDREKNSLTRIKNDWFGRRRGFPFFTAGVHCNFHQLHKARTIWINSLSPTHLATPNTGDLYLTCFLGTPLMMTLLFSTPSTTLISSPLT